MVYNVGTMKQIIACIVSIVLTACGGGSSDVDRSVYTIPTSVNHYVRDLPSNTYNDPPNIVNDWSLTVRHMGANPYDLQNSKFSVNSNYKSKIDVSDRQYVDVVGGGPHSILTLFSDDKIVPLSFSGNLIWEHSGDGVSQLSAFMYVKDATKTGAIVLNLKDSRYSTYEPFVGHDTFTPFVSIPPGVTKYGTITVGQTFKIEITNANWQEILDSMNMSADAKIISYGMLHEVFYMNGQSVVSIVEVSDFKIVR